MYIGRQASCEACRLFLKNIHFSSMTDFKLIYPSTFQATIALPTSKSISARAMILSSLAGGCRLQGLSDSDDTRALQMALENAETLVDIGAAGTAMRFATVFFAVQEGVTRVLTGSRRMKERPIGILVEALRTLGADIEYLEKEGFPPLQIRGSRLKGGVLEIPAHVSSQYISALLMIAPTLQQGLCLRLQGEIASRPYIDMTLSLMQQFGVRVYWNGEAEINIAPQNYVSPGVVHIEADWSAASYWYEMVALSGDTATQVRLKGLSTCSQQGDSKVAELFNELGVVTSFEQDGATLRKVPVATQSEVWEVDFADCPDLAQTLVVTCVMLQKAFRFRGLHSLRIKETDRIAALQTELLKMGHVLRSYQQERGGKLDEILEYIPEENVARSRSAESILVATYKDHRMAMAFAPCAQLYPGLCVEDVEVVSKSYPAFWQHLQQVGVEVTAQGDKTM